MKKGKVLLPILLASMTLGVTSCQNDNQTETPTKETLDLNIFNEDGNRRLYEEPTDKNLIDTFIDSVISQSGELIKGGISAYGKCIVLNLLKECGIDLRDATTKTLEKIQNQLNIIEKKIDAISDRQEQIQAESVLGDLLREFKKATNSYIHFAVGSLGDLVEVENDPNISEEEAEERRLTFYNNTAKKLTVDNLPLAKYVTDLADYVMRPNPADRSKDIFYYYTKTIGTPDVWSIQRYKNVRNFMAYIDSTLINIANLAKFQMYYLSQGKDQATLAGYKGIMDDMAAAVNIVNESFYNFNNSLKDIEDKMKNGINVYLPTNQEYSTRMATLTYNHEDREDDDSRQGLLMSYVNDSGKHGNLQTAYCFEPGEIVSKVHDDFVNYSSAYCAKTYTIQDYLKYAGFYSVNEDLFDKAAGIYNAEWYVDRYGTFNDDKDYSMTYYDKSGNKIRKNVYQVATYHTCIGRIKSTELRYLDDQYYLCFARPVGDKQKLDGTFKEVYMWDTEFTVMESLFFAPHYYEFMKDTPLYLHNCW